MLFLPTYFAPISQYMVILQNDAIVFEVEDNFQKQTYRNRCYIYASLGKLQMNVPIIRTHDSMIKQKTKDTKVDNEYAWQKRQLKTLQAAYRSSPYYEFYEDDIMPIFETKHNFLQDLNIKTHEFILDALQEEISFSKTTEYLKEPIMKDSRILATPKFKPLFKFKQYTQVFDDKYGFIPNLSILDLIFMEGPNAISYLKN
ncbi:WbqC family protein [Urechidicola vernalis]|uniref:WbqC family protein n=1 Tax=Urechidicola vernalis TaxID=3075600 RepID=A0ABU2Y625_9FLAO|nr:WbqC family protein [Urechidicola sp. P050]MDT0552508.1 WbqC family protein [Urechidicola sp. P050]